MLKALLIDHFDSFTANIYRWLEDSFSITLVSYPNWPASLDDFALIILSPGPGAPQDYPHSLQLIKDVHHCPIFGICLGLQMLAITHGLELFQLPAPLHGKCTQLTITQPSQLFAPNTSLQVAHYHSLAIRPNEHTAICALDQNAQFVMVLEDLKRRHLAVQFHPESFLSTGAQKLKENLVRYVIAQQEN